MKNVFIIVIKIEFINVKAIISTHIEMSPALLTHTE